MLGLYAACLTLVSPFLKLYLRARIRRGKEDPSRIKERYGITSQARPKGPLLWCHAASVGEALTLLPLIRAIKTENSAFTILVTTGTLTSAKLLKSRLGDEIIHQFVPLDVPKWTNRFIKHWQPALCIFVESELWPNLLYSACRSKAPCVLVNARLSQKTFEKWKLFSFFSKKIMSCFNIILTQSETDTCRFTKVGAQHVHTIGNLKFSMEKLPVDESKFLELQDMIGGRPVWLLASSHEGEEQMAIAAYKKVELEFRDLLLVIVPRHLERAGQIEMEIASQNLKSNRRSRQERITRDTDIYLADTMGELGIFFQSVPVVVVGGSMVPKGGHNLIEPAQFGCALLHGKYMTASPDIKTVFEQSGAAKTVQNADELAVEVELLLSDAAERNKRGIAAKKTALQQQNIVEQTLTYLRPFLSDAGL